jgi:hypothetical protein
MAMQNQHLIGFVLPLYALGGYALIAGIVGTLIDDALDVRFLTGALLAIIWPVTLVYIALRRWLQVDTPR